MVYFFTSQGEFPLLWKGVEVLDIEMMSKGNGPLNQLRTFWTKKRFELAPSVDRSTDRDNEHAKVCAVHLAHEPFTFKFTIVRLIYKNEQPKISIVAVLKRMFTFTGKETMCPKQIRQGNYSCLHCT